MTEVEQVAVVLGSAIPASLMAVVYTRENGRDGTFLASMLSLLASMLSLALPTSLGFRFILIAPVRS